VETVINGSHYYRSFNILMMLAEAMERLRFEAFSSAVDHDQFNEITSLSSEFHMLKNLKFEMPELYASFLSGDFVVKQKRSFQRCRGRHGFGADYSKFCEKH